MTGPRAVVVSLEDWDDVWRRNQHLAHRLVSLGYVRELVFIQPPRKRTQAEWSPEPGIRVISPPLHVRPALGGFRLSAFWLRRHWCEPDDFLWINNAPLGRWLPLAVSCHDVTDDWRESAQGWATRRRLIRAEDRLARTSTTIVCSDVLQQRWLERYGLRPAVVPNAVDQRTFDAAPVHELPRPGTHVGYVGTLHESRLDVDLVLEVAGLPVVDQLHLVGPVHLSPDTQARLASHPSIRVHGPVPATEVPSWLKAFDVLLLPHLVSPFTLSLDAIKAHEYLATDRPVVATATSGFQSLQAEALSVVPAQDFASAVEAAIGTRPRERRPVVDWNDRVHAFADAAGLSRQPR